jgi:poly(A) polymerase
MDELQVRLSQPLLQRIIPLLPSGVPIYLVGGAVRDAFLNRQSYDLDFVTSGDALKIARKLADDLDAAYFPLDSVRKVARFILRPDEKLILNGIKVIRVDFSTFQGVDLISDLQGRDFSINAMAVEVHQLQTLVDPMSGMADLEAKRLRSCSPRSFLDDPVRILRAVRFSVDLDLNIIPDTFQQMRQAVSHLSEVSTERLRDELFRILVTAHSSTSMRILDKVQALEYVLPEVRGLKDVQQSPPHVLDVWNHTLDILNRLESLLDVLRPDYDPNKAGNLSLGLVALRLGRYRQQLAEHLSNALNTDRPSRGLLFLAGLYHDVGKLATRSVDEFERTKFIGHEQIGSKLAEKRGQVLKLSNLEIERLVTIVKYHMRPSLLSHPKDPPSKKAVYHFFRDTGEAGVDICILSLADMQATYGPTLPQERWIRHLDVVRTLLGAWWEDREERIFPPPFVNGEDLMTELATSEGPMIGYMLESIREAQVVGDVQNRQEAINLAREILERNLNKKRAK